MIYWAITVIANMQLQLLQKLGGLRLKDLRSFEIGATPARIQLISTRFAAITACVFASAIIAAALKYAFGDAIRVIDVASSYRFGVTSLNHTPNPPRA